MTRPSKEKYEQRIRREGFTLIPRMGLLEDAARIVTTLVWGGRANTASHAIVADGGLRLPRS